MGDFFEIVEFLMQSGMAFLTSFNIPLTNFTPLAALFFSAFFIVSMRFLLSLLKSPVKFNIPKRKE